MKLCHQLQSIKMIVLPRFILYFWIIGIATAFKDYTTDRFGVEKSPCGSVKEIKSGKSVILESPNYGTGENYPNSYTCKWTFKSDSEKNCSLGMTCPKFGLYNFFCTDYMEVTDANGNSKTFCGNNGPKKVKLGKEGTVAFKSDLLSNGPGFQCNVACTPDGSTFGSNNDDDGLSCECGVGKTKIVGGEEAEYGEFPWMVGLSRPGGKAPFCGGALINSRYILTAGHCVHNQKENNIEIILNEHDLTTTSEASTFRRRVEKILEHPEHTSRQDYDVALIKLDSPVESEMVNRDVTPICLPSNDELNNLFVGETATVAGWGTTSEGGDQAKTLRKVNVTVISNSYCNLAYFGLITERMICASAPGRDSCQGDSGGPMWWQKEGKAIQIGIVSFGFGCARPASPGVYARVTELIDWIQDNSSDGKTCQK